MVATVIVMGNQGGAFVSHLSLLVLCVALGFVVHSTAPKIHALRGWRKVGANAAMTGSAALAVFVVSLPQLTLAKLAFVMVCSCWWGWDWCCWI